MPLMQVIGGMVSAASAEQGARADTAVQPTDAKIIPIGVVAETVSYPPGTSQDVIDALAVALLAKGGVAYDMFPSFKTLIPGTSYPLARWIVFNINPNSYLPSFQNIPFGTLMLIPALAGDWNVNGIIATDDNGFIDGLNNSGQSGAGIYYSTNLLAPSPTVVELYAEYSAAIANYNAYSA